MSDFIAERMWPGARIDRSIFGTDDPDQIWRFVRDACPEAVDCFAGHPRQTNGGIDRTSGTP